MVGKKTKPRCIIDESFWNRGEREGEEEEGKDTLSNMLTYSVHLCKYSLKMAREARKKGKQNCYYFIRENRASFPLASTFEGAVCAANRNSER